LGLYNAWEAHRAPSQQRQRQFLDDLRGALQPLLPLFDKARRDIAAGLSAGEPPQQLSYAQGRMEQLAPRLADSALQSELTNLTGRLSRNWLSWHHARHAEGVVGMLDPQAGGALGQAREALKQECNHAHWEFQQDLEGTQAAVMEFLQILDRKDRGVRRQRLAALPHR
jgi:hypothetical protein